MMWMMMQHHAMQQQAFLQVQEQFGEQLGVSGGGGAPLSQVADARQDRGTKRPAEDVANEHAEEEVRSPTPDFRSQPSPVLDDAHDHEGQSSHSKEPPTPEVLRRLLAVTAEDEPGMSREQATARLSELALAAQKRLEASPAAPAPSAPPDNQGTVFFSPSEAADARKAMQQFMKDIQDASKSATKSQRDPQMTAKFVHPIESVEVLRTKIAGLHGAAGPSIVVAPADSNKPWKKPSSTVWYAERKGDERKCVFRVNVPAEEGGKGKPKSISLQVLVGGRELSVTAFKSILLKFGGNLLMMFGPHKSIQVNQTTAAGLDLSKFWGQ